MSLIGLTMGDPAGIGPEIILKAAAALEGELAAGNFGLAVVGNLVCMQEAADRLGGPVRPVAANGTRRPGELPVIEAAALQAVVRPGEVSPEGGRLAYRSIETAIERAMSGEIQAIVTAPLHKEALNAAGFAFAGHTEILTALTGAPDSCMMLVHDRLRVAHVTTHCALSEVPKRITPARLRRVVELTLEAVHDLGVKRPRVAVAGLNPHAGEGGIFGDEEIRVIKPVIESFRARGDDVIGPEAGDTVFVRAQAGLADAVVAMYHDQGHVAVKTLAFKMDPATGAMTSIGGVNVTLGLPIVRTSVDHGTAFDIAGKGIANADSMVEAIGYATALITARARRH